MSRIAVILGIIVLMAIGQAFGQVPVNQTGRARDANPMVGSGGYNSMRNADPYAPMTNILSITGRSSRGFSPAMGRVPSASQNDLYLPLPSEAMDTFNSQDALGIRVSQPNAVYSPRSQSYSPVWAGPAAQGASGLIQPAPPLIPRPSVEAEPTAGLMPGMATAISPNVGGLTTPIEKMQMQSVAAVQIGGTMEEQGDSMGRPRMSELFGVLGAEQSAGISGQMANSQLGPLGKQQAGGLAQPGAKTPLTPEQNAQPEQMPERISIPEDDIFTEVILHIMPKRESQLGAPGQEPQDVMLPNPASPTAGDVATDLEALNTEPGKRVASVRPAQDELVEGNGKQVVLHALGGRRADNLNRYMTMADGHLKRGAFYQAAGGYQAAQAINPANPLASIGSALAYFGAGEPRRAGLYLQRAITLFPVMAQVRTDIDRMLGKEVIDNRLMQLEQRLSTSPEQADIPRLLLVTWVYANRGELEQAASWAEKLLPLVGDDYSLSDYTALTIAISKPVTTMPAEKAK